MKKLIILALAATMSVTAFAQSTKKADEAKKKIERSDAAINDAKKQVQVGTWIDRSNAFVDAGTAYTSNLIAELPAAQMTTPNMLGAPKEIEPVELGGVTYDKYIYDKIDMYVTPEGMVSFWNAKEEVYPEAFTKALVALEKAKEISPKDFTKPGKALTAVDRLISEVSTVARNSYMIGQYKDGGKYFNCAFKAAGLKGELDTMSLYYSGLSYVEAEDFAQGKDIFEKMISVGAGQEGFAYSYLAFCLEKLGDVNKAIETYETGFNKFPENASIMGGLINIYLAQDKNPEKLIELIKKAQSVDTKNVSLYLVEAQIWDKIGNKDNTYAALDKAIQIDPTSMQAHYNYALYKLIASDAIVEEANKLPLNDTKTYNAMLEDVKVLRESAVELLEKAYELEASKDLYETLGQIYYICRDYDKKYQEGYEKYQATKQ